MVAVVDEDVVADELSDDVAVGGVDREDGVTVQHQAESANELVFGLELAGETVVVGLADDLAGDAVHNLVMGIGAVTVVENGLVVEIFDGGAPLVDFAAAVVDASDVKDEGAGLDLVVAAGAQQGGNFGVALSGDALVGIEESGQDVGFCRISVDFRVLVDRGAAECGEHGAAAGQEGLLLGLGLLVGQVHQEIFVAHRDTSFPRICACKIYAMILRNCAPHFEMNSMGNIIGID